MLLEMPEAISRVTVFTVAVLQPLPFLRLMIWADPDQGTL